MAELEKLRNQENEIRDLSGVTQHLKFLHRLGQTGMGVRRSWMGRDREGWGGMGRDGERWGEMGRDGDG